MTVSARRQTEQHLQQQQLQLLGCCSVDIVAGESLRSTDPRLGSFSLVFLLVELRHHQLEEFTDVV